MREFWLWLRHLFRPWPPAPEPPAAQAPEMLRELNDVRSRDGLSVLSEHPCLTEQARGCVQKMRLAGDIDAGHDGFQGRLNACGFTDGAENIAFNNQRANDVVTDWMTSTGHRQNLLGEWHYVGFARDGHFWCAIFAR